MEIGDDGMELGERDPNRSACCEILVFCERLAPALVGESRMLFGVICRRSHETECVARYTWAH